MAENDWDAYWRNAREASIFRDGGPKDEMLERFWTRFLNQFFSTNTFSTEPKILDIACGYGAVTNHTVTSAGNQAPDLGLQLYALDTSPAALREVRTRFPRLHCVAGSAALLPFPDETFDLVTSQFGLEYAGDMALLEAARIVKPGGQIGFIMHKRDGGIYRECADNLSALDAVRQSNILQCFAGIFKTAQAVQQSRAGREKFREADEKFSRAVAATEDIFRRFGKEVADGMVYRLYNDIAHMYRRFNVYDPQEVYNWINLMVDEVDTYAGRMASMLKAARNEEEFMQLTGDLKERYFNIQVRDVLNMGKAQIPSAWVLAAEKS